MNGMVFRDHQSLFPSAATQLEAEETIPKRPKSLLDAFNDTDAAVLDVAAAKVPAIAIFG
jgi:hypothetical protein